MADHLLQIKGLQTHFATDEGMVHAVDGIDLFIDRGETLGVVGESGCGKSVTAMTIMKLLAMPPARIVAGEILWQGRDLVPLSATETDAFRQLINSTTTIDEQLQAVTRSFDAWQAGDSILPWKLAA